MRLENEKRGGGWRNMGRGGRDWNILEFLQ